MWSGRHTAENPMGPLRGLDQMALGSLRRASRIHRTALAPGQEGLDIVVPSAFFRGGRRLSRRGCIEEPEYPL